MATSDERVNRRFDDLRGAEEYRNKIKEACKKLAVNGQPPGKFTDRDFSPNSNILDSNRDDVVWKRPNEYCTKPILFVDGVSAGDVIQGALGDCWFLGAQAVLATRVDLLAPVFVYASQKYGLYQLRFYKEGQWRIVTIDDKLPISKSTNLPIYARCRDHNELWVSIIEKAYAKLHGSYAALVSGNTASALKDLTGGPCQKFNIAGSSDMKRFWNHLLWFRDERYLLGASRSSKNEGSEEESKSNGGVLSNHAYSMLTAVDLQSDKLVNLRNP
eukprot:TRINITY_DN4999_c0_g1_i1.p1 TRINITY_DN4999_c0_g1~~TRINITY_DN4999_c0_g1_i1.p1  ORF type:complete len:273 (-),score=34.19 TRINITY_DN4999_c0_g1_i1:34-852(-)